MITGVISIIIGILGALLGVYFKESLRIAQQKKSIATQLEAYLNELLRDIVENPFLKQTFLIGEVWNKELGEAFKEEGGDGVQKINEKYKSNLEKLKSVLKNVSEINSYIENLYKGFRELDEELFNDYIKNLN